MKCACGDQKCTNEIHIDTQGHTLLVSNANHKAILMYLDEKTATQIIGMLYELITDIQKKEG